MLPVSPEDLMMFAQFLSLTLVVPTVQNYIAGVGTLHKYTGFPFPDTSQFFFKLFFKGLARLHPHIPHRAQPITPQILSQIAKRLNFQYPAHITIWSLFLMAFFTFARKSNLVPPTHDAFDPLKHLTRGNIAVSKSGLLVTFVWTKTIQAGGRSLQSPVTSIPGSILCPVAAYQHMITRIPAPSQAPAFLVPGPKGLTSITHNSMVTQLRGLIRELGLPPLSFRGHSFRRGGASWAFSSGVQGELVKLLGDWRSDAYLKYLDSSLEDKLSVSQAMAQSIQMSTTN